jgi:hypothetical protein
MTRKAKITSITVFGRKWFDKVNGNTYCTAQIMINGITVGKTPFQYGYGDFYMQAASEWLREHKYIKADKYTALWRYGLGMGTVESYFIESEWLGVTVRLDHQPEWHKKQRPNNPIAMVFGLEIQQLTGAKVKSEVNHG